MQVLQKYACKGLEGGLQSCCWSARGGLAAATYRCGPATGLLVVNTALQLQLQINDFISSMAWSPCSSTLAYVCEQHLCFCRLPHRRHASSDAHVVQLEALQAALGTEPVQQVSWSLQGPCLVVTGSQLYLAGLGRSPVVAVLQDSSIQLLLQKQLPQLSPTGDAVLFMGDATSGWSSPVCVLRRLKKGTTDACVLSRADPITRHKSQTMSPFAFTFHPSGRLYVVLADSRQFSDPHEHWQRVPWYLLVYTSAGRLVQSFGMYGGERGRTMDSATACLTWSPFGDHLHVKIRNDGSVSARLTSTT